MFLSFSVRLTPRSLASSRSVHVVASGGLSPFPRPSGAPLCAAADGPWGSRALAVVNNAAVNIGVHVSF